MSSEVHKYIEKAIDNKKSLLEAEIISFPNEEETKNFKSNDLDHWKIYDKSNDDQLKAVTGICMMFVILVIMGIYSNIQQSFINSLSNQSEM